MSIKLLFVGRSGDMEFKVAVERYVERASRFVKTEVQFVKEEPSGSRPELGKILAGEAKRIVAALQPRDLLVLCDDGGRERSSETFATELRRWLDESPSAVVFVVGGAFGLDPSLRSRSRAILPLSRLTLPHQLARLVLAEQVYRAIAAQHGVAYSK
ncbi:MAG: 23S rRNA (pseudouridine(1915)-N(3))-methyltransferase RlmH [Thermoanaerobaculia bacterium]